MRTQFIEKGKSTNDKEFSSTSFKNDSKNCEIKSLTKAFLTNGGDLPTLKLFQINNQQNIGISKFEK